MIDIENEIFTIISSKLKEKFPNITVSNENNLNPAAFPFVSISEADNYVNRKTQDSGNTENHANLMYEINVFSNKKGGRITECKAIFNFVDEILSNLGFTRMSKTPIPLQTAMGYRMTGRYTAVVSKNKTIYRR